MILFIVAVRDSAIDGFNHPFFVPSLGLAVRHFGDEVKREDSPMFAHPSDYFLCSLGTFDTDTGVFESTLPEQIARGADYKSS